MNLRRWLSVILALGVMVALCPLICPGLAEPGFYRAESRCYSAESGLYGPESGRYGAESGLCAQISGLSQYQPRGNAYGWNGQRPPMYQHNREQFAGRYGYRQHYRHHRHHRGPWMSQGYNNRYGQSGYGGYPQYGQSGYRGYPVFFWKPSEQLHQRSKSLWQLGAELPAGSIPAESIPAGSVQPSRSVQPSDWTSTGNTAPLWRHHHWQHSPLGGTTGSHGTTTGTTTTLPRLTTVPGSCGRLATLSLKSHLGRGESHPGFRPSLRTTGWWATDPPSPWQ